MQQRPSPTISRVTAPEYELMIMTAPLAATRLLSSACAWRTARTDKSKTAAVIKYLDNVAAHLPAFALVFSTGDERSFPLGGAGTASAAVVAHADAYRSAPSRRVHARPVAVPRGGMVPLHRHARG